MNSLLFLSPFLQFPLLILVALAHFPAPSTTTNNTTEWFTTCGTLFNCGAVTGIGYPFWGDQRPQNCGHPGLELDCDDDVPTVEIMSIRYRVLGINPVSKMVTIAREDFIEDLCLEEFANTTLDSSIFDYAPGYQNVTFLYGCPPTNGTVPISGQFNCPISGVTGELGHVEVGARGPGVCHASVVVPVRGGTFPEGTGELSGLSRVVNEGFEVRLREESGVASCDECKDLGGECGFNLGADQFTCLCPSGPNSCTAATTERGSGLLLPINPAQPRASDPAGPGLRDSAEPTGDGRGPPRPPRTTLGGTGMCFS